MILKNLNKNFLVNLFLVLSIFLFDRISKIYVIHLDKKFFGSEIFSSKFLNINLIWNKGIAFGLLSFNQETFYNFLTILISFIILIILFLILRTKGIEKYTLLMILGGALGNLYDRILYKAVPDFIDFHIGNLHWFIFNPADIFISIGVICLILDEFFFKNKKND